MNHSIQRAIATLYAAEWMPITAVRVLIGIFFCISGGTKLFVPAQFNTMERTLAESHIPFPHASALFVSLVEFACGAGLVLGLLTPLCALLLAADMIVAIAANRIHSIQASNVVAGGFQGGLQGLLVQTLTYIDDFLYLPEVLYVMILVWLIFSGPGRFSIDGWIARLAGVAGEEHRT